MNWKLIIFRVLINGLAISATALLLSGVSVPQPTWVKFLILGLTIGLLNAFVKPLIQVLTISLLFVTFGLVIVVVNAVMLLLLGIVLPPGYLDVQSLWAALLGGLLLAVFSSVFENLLGMTRPIVDREAPASLEAPSTPLIEQPRYHELMADLKAAKQEMQNSETQQS